MVDKATHSFMCDFLPLKSSVVGGTLLLPLGSGDFVLRGELIAYSRLSPFTPAEQPCPSVLRHGAALLRFLPVVLGTPRHLGTQALPRPLSHF